MKKILSLLLLIVMTLFTCSCESADNTDGSQSQGTGTTQNANTGNTAKNNLGNYNVIIESCRLAMDYADEPVVIVKYKFTNNDSDPACFSYTIEDSVYQNGVGLNHSYLVDDSADYSADNQTKEIKKGVSLYVEVAYELNDTTTDIEVEVSELIS